MASNTVLSEAPDDGYGQVAAEIKIEIIHIQWTLDTIEDIARGTADLFNIKITP